MSYGSPKKVEWMGQVMSVQPRIRLTRSFDQRSHTYPLAHGAFETARDLYLSQGRKPEWDSVVVDIVSEHGRKYSFMPAFRRIAGLQK